MYDVIVVGAGHAGIEAAYAASRLGKKVCLITSHLESIGHLPCNPSIGGPAKGIVVREIDALGGAMGYAADQNYLQLKMLNTTKGPAVQSLRAQIDKIKYPKYMQNLIINDENITLVIDTAIALINDGNNIIGVKTKDNGIINSKKTILTTGTYLKATRLVSDTAINIGPDGFLPANELSDSLSELGVELQRLKTGTPARVDVDSIDFTKTSVEKGSDAKLAFSELTNDYINIDDQWPCFLTYTSFDTHQLINDNLHRSSMYSGLVKGIGPRYCPSIEDKIVRFADKDRHQIFLEPESSELNTIYVQGFSTSMPEEVQEKMLKSLPGLENVKIIKYGYAIEYDAINPIQLNLTLEHKKLHNLYFAGQVNGTSGYEEAAGQGIIAGINAALSIDDKQPLILKRHEAYIGVMIDDLVTKGTKEPYRLLTSRAEYRLLLRSDNAPFRLSGKAKDLGLLNENQLEKLENLNNEILELNTLLQEIRFTPKHPINDDMKKIDSSPLFEGVSGYDLLKRPEIKIEMILPYLDKQDFSQQALQQIEIEIKYEGYIKKAKKQAEQFEKLENKLIPEDIDYSKIPNLALEALQKFSNIRPENIGQASRISGINPSDIQNLLLYLKRGA